MIWVVIIIIICFILFKFFTAREKMMKGVDQQGGMEEKYSILLSHLIADQESKLSKLTRDNIQLVVKTKYFTNNFSIIQSFTDIIIIWHANSPLGEFKEKWQFPQHFDQHQMAKKIGQDMEFKINNFGDYDELARRINKASDEFENDLNKGRR